MTFASNTCGLVALMHFTFFRFVFSVRVGTPVVSFFCAYQQQDVIIYDLFGVFAENSSKNDTSRLFNILRDFGSHILYALEVGLWRYTCFRIKLSAFIKYMCLSQMTGDNSPFLSTLCRVNFPSMSYLNIGCICRLTSAQPQPKILVVDFPELTCIGPFRSTSDWSVQLRRQFCSGVYSAVS